MPVVVLFLLPSLAAGSDRPSLNVVYPKPGQVVTAVDSTFILGSLIGNCDTREYRLTINGEEIPLHRDGGFLAFLPVQPGEFAFQLKLFGRDLNHETAPNADTPLSILELPVLVPKPLQTLPDTILQIAGDYRAPRGDLVLTAGDRLEVMFRGTPDLTAWFSIEGAVDSMPMSETPPRLQPYWGESVFGAGAVPESVKVGGIYSGFLDVPDSISVENVTIVYHLAPFNHPGLIARLLADPADTTAFDWLLSVLHSKPLLRESSYRISLNPPDYPFAVKFTDSVQIIRHGPRKGYFSIFQPEGVIALVVGAEGNWYKTRLSATQYAWVNAASAERLPKGILPPKSYLTSVRTYGLEDSLIVTCPLSGRHPFRVIEDDKRTVRIQLYGVTADTDWIRYDFSDSTIDIATWSQPEPDLYELSLSLKEDVWGYDAYFVGNTFHFKLNKPPANLNRLRGKRIVIDPGHSRSPGAIGPTGLTEAEANLDIALELADILHHYGADIILTRDDDRHLPLYDRPAIASLYDADLFVSVHNNALPDGVNPFTNNGVSTYYYHPHSIELARSVQKRMIKATGMADYGMFHGNLAVNRPTQYPAILVECAFIILPEQEALLKTKRFRSKVANAIVRGIEDFLRGYDDSR